MRITRVETVQLRSGTEVHTGSIGWLWVRIHTSDGLAGTGETYPATDAEKAVVLSDYAPQLVGRDARDIEAIWNDLFRSVQYRMWAGAEIRALSAVDTALWDLLARSLDVPLYVLLGGKCWDWIPVYNTCYDDHFDFNAQPVELARELAAAGIHAMKIWPFDEVARATRGQRISTAEMDECIRPIARIRDSMGARMEVAVEFHGLWNLPCAIEIAHALEPYQVMWLEEMMPQENLTAYARLASKISQPLCLSERLPARWRFRELLESGAASIVMPDIAWCGGISEARRICSMADTEYLPIAPHNCGGPILHFASWHLGCATPNLRILETVRRHYSDRFVGVVTLAGAPVDGQLGLPPGPGLGVELAPDFLTGGRAQIDSFDG